MFRISASQQYQGVFVFPILPFAWVNIIEWLRLLVAGQEFRGGLEGDVGYTTHSRVPWTVELEEQLHGTE